MEKRSVARKQHKASKAEEDMALKLVSLLRDREHIRPIDDVREELEEARAKTAKTAGAGPEAGNQPPEDETQAGTSDIFARMDDKLVAAKVAVIREVQHALEHSNKWMWTLKKQGAFQAFAHPKRSLEQYITPLPDALSIGYILQSELQDKMIADIGAGTGMLGITSLLAGAKYVHFFEIDPDAAKILARNCAKLIDDQDSDDGSEEEGEEEEDEDSESEKQVAETQKLGPLRPTISSGSYTIHNKNVLTVYPTPLSAESPKLAQTEVLEAESGEEEAEAENKKETASEVIPLFDVVIMNPPFGTSKDEDIDVEFVKVADRLLKPEPGASIFFVHKIARTKGLQKHATAMGYHQNILWEFYLEVPLLLFDSKDFQDNFMNKPAEGEKGQKAGGANKRGKKGAGTQRFRHKKGSFQLNQTSSTSAAALWNGDAEHQLRRRT